MGSGFSPLDEELGLLPGPWSPHLAEHLARLGARLPFAEAAAEVTAFTHVAVSETTVRRHTEQAGAAYVQVQTAAVEAIERAAQQPSWEPTSASASDASRPSPDVLQLSVDGAMVPLVGGTWAEVKTLALGAVVVRPGRDGAPEPHASDLSYFSRLADAATFTRLASSEVHRRGVDRARVVVAPQDGADWEQTFLDVHRPDAVRILDFPHAVEYLTKAAQAVWGVETPEAAAWLAAHCHELKHGSAHRVVRALARLPVEQAAQPTAASEQRTTSLQYLTKRLDQLQYATFQALGYPIGSGCVESANKLVVEARLKGSGMHWARDHVNPVVALRTALCSARWPEAWGQITAHQRRQLHRQRQMRRQMRRAAQPQTAAPPVVVHPARPLPAAQPTRPSTIVGGRPTADHPWKRRPFLAGGRRFAAAHPKT